MTGSRQGHEIEVVGATPESEALSSVFAECGVLVGKVPRVLLRAETPPGTELQVSAQLIHPRIPRLCIHLLSVCHYHRYALWKCIQTPFKTAQLPRGRLLVHSVSWSLQQLAKMWHTTQAERKPSKTQAGLDIPRIPLIGELPLPAASLRVKSSYICARKSRSCKS